ncbi:cell division protein ZapC [Psychromonas sp.]|nr:cell division protein ZapC [Psychromonas sp.]
MDFIPKADWKWVYDHKQSNLSVVDRDRIFPLVYQSSMLRLRESQSVSFTVEDVTRYIELFESTTFSDIEESLRCKTILHLLAIELFHKPIMPKSWLFQTVDAPKQRYHYGELVMLTTSGIPESAKYMVLEQQDNFCLCMLFDESHVFPNNKEFKQFEIVKVSTDKLIPCLQVEQDDCLFISNAV